MYRAPALLSRASNSCWLARIKPVSPPTRLSAAKRLVHTRRTLQYNELDPFLSEDALSLIAVEYQQGLLERLNQLVKGTKHARTSVAQTVIDTARDPNSALTFTYASRALNNSFFLENLKPLEPGQQNHEDKMSTDLQGAIVKQYKDLSYLKEEVGGAALGMCSGYVWVVIDKYGNIGVLPTFASGTFLVRAQEPRYLPTDPNPKIARDRAPEAPPHYRTFGEPDADDAALPEPAPLPPSGPATHHTDASQPPPTSPTSGLSHGVPPFAPSTPSRQFSTHPPARAFGDARTSNIWDAHKELNHANSNAPGSQSDARRFVGEDMFPLFCVSVNEHAWMAGGYGVWGQEKYLRQFWTVLDWERVNAAWGRFVVARYQRTV